MTPARDTALSVAIEAVSHAKGRGFDSRRGRNFFCYRKTFLTVFNAFSTVLSSIPKFSLFKFFSRFFSPFSTNMVKKTAKKSAISGNRERNIRDKLHCSYDKNQGTREKKCYKGESVVL